MNTDLLCPDCGAPFGMIRGRVNPRGGHTFIASCGHEISDGLARQAHDAGRRVWVEPVTGAGLISAERARQRAEEGYDASHDAAHHDRELPWAAWSYLDAAASDAVPSDEPPVMWPWGREAWRPKGKLRMLVIAGALIAAEIDRRLAHGERL